MTYERKYGKIEGITERTADWVRRVSEDKALPWVGLGLIDDLEVILRLLSLEEFGAWLHTHSDDELQRWGVEVQEAAAARAELDELPTAETLADNEQAAEAYDAVRNVLVECGALSADDTDTDVPALLRALLA